MEKLLTKKRRHHMKVLLITAAVLAVAYAYFTFVVADGDWYSAHRGVTILCLALVVPILMLVIYGYLERWHLPKILRWIIIIPLGIGVYAGMYYSMWNIKPNIDRNQLQRSGIETTAQVSNIHLYKDWHLGHNHSEEGTSDISEAKVLIFTATYGNHYVTRLGMYLPQDTFALLAYAQMYKEMVSNHAVKVWYLPGSPHVVMTDVQLTQPQD